MKKYLFVFFLGFLSLKLVGQTPYFKFNFFIYDSTQTQIQTTAVNPFLYMDSCNFRGIRNEPIYKPAQWYCIYLRPLVRKAIQGRIQQECGHLIQTCPYEGHFDLVLDENDGFMFVIFYGVLLPDYGRHWTENTKTANTPDSLLFEEKYSLQVKFMNSKERVSPYFFGLMVIPLKEIGGRNKNVFIKTFLFFLESPFSAMLPNHQAKGGSIRINLHKFDTPFLKSFNFEFDIEQNWITPKITKYIHHFSPQRT